MKIVRREYANPLHNFTLWLIPTCTYIGMKAADSINSSKEWVWWVAIPSLVLIWGLINWKVKK